MTCALFRDRSMLGWTDRHSTASDKPYAGCNFKRNMTRYSYLNEELIDR